jgi:hypothetical protein
MEGWWCSSKLGAEGLEEDRRVDMNRELRDVSEFVEYDEVGIEDDDAERTIVSSSVFVTEVLLLVG